MLSELEGQDWVPVEPPREDDGESTVARYQGEPIKAGFLTERIEDSEDLLHLAYRSGKYDLEVKVDFSIGRGLARVEEAEGYDQASDDQ